MGLEKLLYLQGVGAEFIDCDGQLIQIPQQDRAGILTAMLANKLAKSDAHVDIQHQLSTINIEQKIYQLDVEQWCELLPSFQFSYLSEPCLHFHLPKQGAQVKITIKFDDSNIDAVQFQCNTQQLTIIGEYHYDNIHYCRYQIALDEYVSLTIPCGYHSITIECINTEQRKIGKSSATLLIAPDVTYQLKEPQTDIGYRPWGISIQLYSVRHEEHYAGIGDFKSLKEVIEMSADLGADFVMLNPLHALDITYPENASPYSPSDRRRLNPLYIDIEALAEQIGCDHQKPECEVNLFDDTNIDYQEVSRFKYGALKLMYEFISCKSLKVNNSFIEAFNTFKRQQGQKLLLFIEHELAHAPEWLTMPADFYAFLQFVATQQLIECQSQCKNLGMKIGLIGDLAIGALLHGNEVQSEMDQFCSRASIGAPPDPFSTTGQNWGLTPLDPVKLKQHDFSHFIQLIRSNMSLYGGLRIDHVMGMLRLWWWPLDKNLGNGAYVYYPVETLLAIITIESHRAKCVVIGEDLGIVPPEIIGAMHDKKLFSNELFYFTHNYHGFAPCAHHKQHSLMMLANHDVPTLKGWWTQQDLYTRYSLSLFESEQEYTQAVAERQHQRYQLVQWLHAGITKAQQSNKPIPKAINLALAELNLQSANAETLQQLHFESLLTVWLFVASMSHSTLFCVQLADLIEEVHGVNIPGTWKEYPNWQRRLPLSTNEIKHRIIVRTRCELINDVRRNSPKPS
ncbi:4-alpha-glucanotransferase [Shewanella gaetbuli]